MPPALRPPAPSRRVVWYVTRRLLWAVAVVYAVMSAIFVLAVSTPDPEREALRWGAHRAGEEADLPEVPPLREQYVDWVTSFVSLEWGVSVRASLWTGEPRLEGEPASNAAAILEAVPITLAYVVPSTVLAFGFALLLGYYAAMRPHSWRSRLPASSMYLLFSVPNFFLAAVLSFTLRDLELGWFPTSYDLGASIASVPNLLWLSLPTFVLTTHLLAGYFRYTRAETRESLAEEFVTVVRAKGAGPRRVARHVFRKAAVPLTTLFVTEVLGVLLVTVFVIEVVFEVPGVGFMAYDAVTNREVELVMVLTVLFAAIIVVANLLQDLAAVVLDARVEP